MVGWIYGHDYRIEKQYINIAASGNHLGPNSITEVANSGGIRNGSVSSTA